MIKEDIRFNMGRRDSGIKFHSNLYTGFQDETNAYVALNPGQSWATYKAIDDNICLIKYSTGIVLASVTCKLSLASGYYFITQSSTDLRPYALISGVQFAVNDGSKTATFGGPFTLGTGETEGIDLITGGNFTSWSGSDPNALPDGWLADGTRNATNYTKEVTGKCQLISDGTMIGIKQTVGAVSGRLYKQTIDVDIITTGGIYTRLTDQYGNVNSSQQSYTTTGSKVAYFTGDSLGISPIAIIRRNSGTTNVIFDNYVLKQVLTPDISGWLATTLSDAGINPNAASFTITITRS